MESSEHRSIDFRALSAFYICLAKKNQIRKNPNFSIGEVAKEIGRRWRELSASKKGPYEKKAAKLKAKYWEDKAQYEAELAEEEE